MVSLHIEIDEDTIRLLTELASEYEGNLSLALADFFRSHDGMEQLWKEAKRPKKLACVLSGTDPKRISSKTKLLAGLTSKLTVGCEDSIRHCGGRGLRRTFAMHKTKSRSLHRSA